MNQKCLSDTELEPFLADPGRPIPPEWESHLADCEECTRTVLALRETDGSPDAAPVPQKMLSQWSSLAVRSPRFFPLRKTTWIAAAAFLVAAGLSIPFFQNHGSSGDPIRPNEEGDWISYADLSRKQSMALAESALPVHCVISGRTRVTFFPQGEVAVLPQRDGRYGFSLRRGSMEACIQPEGEKVYIRTPNGELRDIGTAFRVTVFPLPDRFRPDGESAVTWIEVQEGSVEAKNRRETATISAVHGGFLWSEAAFQGQLKMADVPASQTSPEYLESLVNRVIASHADPGRNLTEEWILLADRLLAILERKLTREKAEQQKNDLKELHTWTRSVVRMKQKAR